MTLTLVTPPVGPVASLSRLKQHLRIDTSIDDVQLEALEATTVALLDGPTGILGRAILPQTWRQTFTGAGPYRLAMPDVSDVEVTVDGEVVSGTVTSDCRGPIVELASYSDAAAIEFACGLSEGHRLIAELAVCFYVEHAFDRIDLNPFYHDLVEKLRWVKI